MTERTLRRDDLTSFTPGSRPEKVSLAVVIHDGAESGLLYAEDDPDDAWVLVDEAVLVEVEQ